MSFSQFGASLLAGRGSLLGMFDGGVRILQQLLGQHHATPYVIIPERLRVADLGFIIQGCRLRVEG